MDLFLQFNVNPFGSLLKGVRPSTRQQLSGGVIITLMTAAEQFITAPTGIMYGLYIQMYGLSPGVMSVISVVVSIFMMPFEIFMMMNMNQIELMLGGKRKLVIGLCIVSLFPPTYLFCHPPSYIIEPIIEAKTEIFSTGANSNVQVSSVKETDADPICTTDVGYKKSAYIGFYGKPPKCEAVRACIVGAITSGSIAPPFSNATPTPYYRDGIGAVVLTDGIQNWLSENGTKPHPDPWHRVAAQHAFLYAWHALTTITTPISGVFLMLATKVLFYQLVTTQEMRLAMATFKEYFGALMTMAMHSLQLWLAKAHGEDKLWQVQFFTGVSLFATCIAYMLSTCLQEPPPEPLVTANNIVEARPPKAEVEETPKEEKNYMSSVRVDLGMNPVEILADVRSVLQNPLTRYQITMNFIGILSSAGGSLANGHDVVQFIMHLENPAVLTSAVAIFMTPLNLAVYPLGYALMTKWEKNHVSSLLMLYKALELFLLSFLSPFGLILTYPMLQVTHTIIHSARTMSQVAYMGDVLDYDTFRAGRNRMVTVSMIESVVLTRSNSLVSLFNGILITVSGYRINGDCECGCGVPCQRPYLRWSCPTDVGYACTRKLEKDNVPFLGDPTRYAACTMQNSYVTFVIRFFYFYWPVCFLFIEAYYWWHYPFKTDTRLLLDDQLKRRVAGLQTIDPITFEISSLDTVNKMNMFSDEEVLEILSGKSASLICWLRLKTSLYGFLTFATMVVGMLLNWLMPHPLHGLPPPPPPISVIISTIGVLTGLLMVINGVKLYTSLSDEAELRCIVATQKFEDHFQTTRVVSNSRASSRLTAHFLSCLNAWVARSRYEVRGRYLGGVLAITPK